MADIEKYAGKIPYGFILEHLLRDDIVIKPMFGCYAVYAGERLCLFLVERQDPLEPRSSGPKQNGVYIATTSTHTAGLMAEIPHARPQQLKGGKVWIFASSDLPEFEEYAVRACELISLGDARIGR